MNFFGLKVRELRENKGILLRQLAAFMEVDTALISKIERGERKANRYQVTKIAKFLEIDEEILVTLWITDKVQTLIAEEPQVAYDVLNMVKNNMNQDNNFNNGKI